MKKILMIANFISFPFEGGNSRFIYLMNLLNNVENKYELELVTSDFFHCKKEKRVLDSKVLETFEYKITLLNEPGYKKNVSLKRFYSHYVLSKNLKTYLTNMEKKPNLIYCAVPSLDLAYEAAKYASKNNIRFIIDIQDLWPEAFKMVFNIPLISNFIFYPMKTKANYIYSKADEIIAVSDTYKNRALQVNKKSKKAISVFLGTDLQKFDKCKEEYKVEFNDEFVRIVYIGTLGHSYNIPYVIEALEILYNKGYNNIKFLVMGDGPLKNSFEDYAKNKNVNIEFLGRLQYPKMVGILASCDIAVNPINNGAAQSIINKVGDYAMAGLPVINTQECEEYRELIENYNIGFNCNNEDIEDLVNKFEELINNKEIRIEQGKNNRKLAEEKFGREKTYINIIKNIV